MQPSCCVEAVLPRNVSSNNLLSERGQSYLCLSVLLVAGLKEYLHFNSQAFWALAHAEAFLLAACRSRGSPR